MGDGCRRVAKAFDRPQIIQNRLAREQWMTRGAEWGIVPI